MPLCKERLPFETCFKLYNVSQCIDVRVVVQTMCAHRDKGNGTSICQLGRHPQRRPEASCRQAVVA